MFKVLIVSANSAFKRRLVSSLQDETIELQHSVFLPAKSHRPEKDGFELLIILASRFCTDAWKMSMEYRKYDGMLPIVLVSEIDTSSARTVSYSIGIDEHISKSVDKVISVIKAISVRPYLIYPELVHFRGYTIDLTKHTVSRSGELVILTHTEQQIFEHLLKHPGRVYGAGELVDILWSNPEDVYEETVRSHIKNLRKKLDSPATASIIDTIHGQGYQLSKFESIGDIVLEVQVA